MCVVRLVTVRRCGLLRSRRIEFVARWFDTVPRVGLVENSLPVARVQAGWLKLGSRSSDLLTPERTPSAARGGQRSVAERRVRRGALGRNGMTIGSASLRGALR